MKQSQQSRCPVTTRTPDLFFWTILIITEKEKTCSYPHSVVSTGICTIITCRRIMDREQFTKARAKLGKTQKALAELLGVSLKAVQSYEQGWRTVPIHVERQLFFLLVSQRGSSTKKRKDCWTLKKCGHKKECPAWEFQAGNLCWFLSGTLCECAADKNWKEKMQVCRECDLLSTLL